ncbi:DUF309 domain-containing protein [Metabacillus sp. RGM 3146]|uniref:DUF309 domain-containing protein n=1 Tax=Metabacillus sp. RGM 3146 TaxID=3401092 RepID=UPI003B9D7208
MYPKAYIDYLVHFHSDRDYFECHEILEDYWKKDPPDCRNILWVGFIQLAVALYHQRRNNFEGSTRLIRNAYRILTNKKQALIQLGLDEKQFILLLKTRMEQIGNKEPYRSINLPIKDPELLSLCQLESKKSGFAWGNDSDISNNHLIHRHTLRDREEVIAERSRQKELRKRKRES